MPTPAVSALSTPPDDAPAAYPPRRVYSVVGVPPEIQAYALAKYSRSSQGMLETIQELSAQKAEQFLTTFYFQYGHRSIADLAHLVFGLEQISILAAIAVVDEPVWDGQERSTRYQPFRKTGWHLPAEVAGSVAEGVFAQTAEGLFGAYEGLSAALLEQHAVIEAGHANWPYRVRPELASPDGTIRMQFCTGAPGVIATASDYLDDDLLLAGAELAWDAGPPGMEKGPALCHGTAGTGYAFLKTFERTQDERWLKRARRFAMHALHQVARRGSGRYSLWTGDVGAALFAADCIDARSELPIFDVL